MTDSTIGNTAGSPSTSGTKVGGGGFVIPPKFDLCMHATLIRIKIRVWGASEKCEEASYDAAQAAGGDAEFFSTTMRHVPKKHPLKVAVEKKVNEARNYYAQETSFWDGGSRLVTNLQYARIIAELNRIRAEFIEAAGNFLDGLPQMEAVATSKQGKHAGKFPSRSEVERLFSFEITTSAIADPNDIRLKHVSADTATEIENATRSLQATRVTGAMNRLMARMVKAFENFAEQMNSETQGYHATAVTNMQELAEIIPELNLTGDPGINAMARRLTEMFSGLTSKDLKEDPEKRKTLTAKTGDLLKRVREMASVSDKI